MIVLGIQRGHDASVCLMCAGRDLRVVEAEPVHGNKHVDGPGTIPEVARVAFSQSGVRPQDIDGIVIADGFRDRIESSVPNICDPIHSAQLLCHATC
jgi:predicted NodU family carbamoyl transferase